MQCWHPEIGRTCFRQRRQEGRFWKLSEACVQLFILCHLREPGQKHSSLRVRCLEKADPLSRQTLPLLWRRAVRELCLSMRIYKMVCCTTILRSKRSLA